MWVREASGNSESVCACVREASNDSERVWANPLITHSACDATPYTFRPSRGLVYSPARCRAPRVNHRASTRPSGGNCAPSPPTRWRFGGRPRFARRGLCQLVPLPLGGVGASPHPLLSRGIPAPAAVAGSRVRPPHRALPPPSYPAPPSFPAAGLPILIRCRRNGRWCGCRPPARWGLRFLPIPALVAGLFVAAFSCRAAEPPITKEFRPLGGPCGRANSAHAMTRFPFQLRTRWSDHESAQKFVNISFSTYRCTLYIGQHIATIATTATSTRASTVTESDTPRGQRLGVDQDPCSDRETFQTTQSSQVKR